MSPVVGGRRGTPVISLSCKHCHVSHLEKRRALEGRAGKGGGGQTVRSPGESRRGAVRVCGTGARGEQSQYALSREREQESLRRRGPCQPGAMRWICWKRRKSNREERASISTQILQTRAGRSRTETRRSATQRSHTPVGAPDDEHELVP
ncbi:hypothetical protein BD413DRAFT_146569 [Trametes elegans]|nr:hypothetical protein BD413DRAFT_146569 [Trametes elegans]